MIGKGREKIHSITPLHSIYLFELFAFSSRQGSSVRKEYDDSWPMNDIDIGYLSVVHCRVAVSSLLRSWLIPCEIQILTALKFLKPFQRFAIKF